MDTHLSQPMLFDFADMTIVFLGHTTTHKPQPLHRSVSIIILPAILSIRIAYLLFSPRFHRGFFPRKNRILTGHDTHVKPKGPRTTRRIS